MEQFTDSQYDDDLTIGTDDYGDSFQTSDIDLFEFGGDEDSPISRLKTLVLSIDWEITDEVLLQFYDEIQDLKDIWAEDKVNMVYLQALEKIGLYINREKADSHPNSIKLLLSMYYNLERIVLSEELSGAEKKQILLDDVRRFEKLKKLIGKGIQAKTADVGIATDEDSIAVPEPVVVNELLDLKAIVLGIDWEITEKDLLELREEVKRLEQQYADSRPRLVFLQGIGTLGAYIRKKKSDSHADAFKLLHTFYNGLEKIVTTQGITLSEEKAILLPEVEKFNDFKKLIAQTLHQGDEVDESPADQEPGPVAGWEPAPAFADMPEETTRGFQEEEEAAALGLDSSGNVDDHISRFFGGEEAAPAAPPAVEHEFAAGIDDAEKEAEALSEAFFGSGDESAPAAPVGVDKEIALQGVDVETEADDDTDEEALPTLGAGEIAPALADTADVSAFSEVAAEVEEAKPEPEDELSDEITGRLDDFFGTEAVASEEDGEREPSSFEVPADIALQGVDVESEDDEEEDKKELQQAAVDDTLDFEELAPAFADLDDDLVVPEDVLSDSELPMEPTEFQQDITPDEVSEPDVDIESEVRALESEEVADEISIQIDTEPLDEVQLSDEEKELVELEPARLEEEVSELDALSDEEIELELQTEEDMLTVPGLAEGTEILGDEAEIEESIEDFFSLEDQETEEIAIEEIAEEGDVAETGLVELTEDVAAPVEEAPLEGAEEEVVFELAEDEVQAEFEADAIEEVELEADDLSTEAVVAGAALAAGSTVAAVATSDQPEEESVEPFEEELEGSLEAEAEVEETAEIVSALEEPGADELLEVEAEAEALTDLRGAVQSLSLEVDESIIQGVFSEINTLRQQYAENAVGKTYLQLMSTIVQHIDQYRFNADDKANELLGSVMEDLENSESLAEDKAQEALLATTCRVLQWQQTMLNDIATRDEDGFLSLKTPIIADQESALTDEKIVEEADVPVDEDTEFVTSTEEQIEEVEELSAIEEIDVQEPAAMSAIDVGFADAIREEINALRDTLKKEIEELRNSLKE